MQRVANADVTHEADRSFIVLNSQIRNAAASAASALISIRVIITLHKKTVDSIVRPNRGVMLRSQARCKRASSAETLSTGNK